MRLRLSTLADADLSSLYGYGFDAFGEAQADRYYDGLLDALERVRLHPRAARRLVIAGQEFRILRYRSHVIAYHLADDMVVVDRVLHGARDVKRHLRS